MNITEKKNYPNGNIGIICDSYEYLIAPKGVLKEFRVIKENDALKGSLEIVIPSELDGIKITRIENDFVSYTSKEYLSKVEIEDGIIIEPEAFYDCKALRYVRWNDYNIIPDSCFLGCKNLSKIENLSAVEEVERYAFRNCLKLAHIKLPKTVKHIGYQAFEHCSSLVSFDWPDDCEIISANIFYNCESLCEINNIEHISIIESHAFCNTAFKKFTIPSKCENLAAGVFSSCSKLEEIVAAPGRELHIYANSLPLYNRLRLDFSQRVSVYSYEDISKHKIILPFYS